MTDIFLSYSRQNSDFVTRLNDALAAHGKDVWLDLHTIADGEVFPDAIRRAIEESEAFVFVISPASLASAYCGHEVDHAAALGKRIVPVLHEVVPDDEIPAAIAERNWVPFLDDGEFERSVDRVVVAVDTDLEYRREHTRWLVKAAEWDREGRDRSFLLRGSELTAAESWLAAAQTDADPPPTELQRSYLLASRQSNLRRQRRFAVAGLSVGAVAIALLVFALISRSQAVTAEATASSRALAAESQNLLTTDPETSVLVASKALEVSPTPDALYAVRQALDHSTVEHALPPAKAATNCEPVALFDGHEPLVLRVAVGGQLTAYRESTGTVAWHETLARANSCVLALDPARDLAAVAVASDVDLVDPSTGTVSGQLNPAALSGPSAAGSPAVMAFSQDGSRLAVLTNSGQIELWNVGTGTGRVLSTTIPNLYGMAFVADGSEMVLGTQTGTFLVVDISTGQVVRTVTVGVPGDGIEVAADPAGSTLAVADSTVSNARTTVVTLWNTATWTQESTLAHFGVIGIDTLAFSQTGDRLAIGEADGAASVWSVSHEDELAPLLGLTSDLDRGVLQPRRHECPGVRLGRFSSHLPGDRPGLGNRRAEHRSAHPGIARLGRPHVLVGPHVQHGNLRSFVSVDDVVVAGRYADRAARAQHRPQRHRRHLGCGRRRSGTHRLGSHVDGHRVGGCRPAPRPHARRRAHRPGGDRHPRLHGLERQRALPRVGLGRGDHQRCAATHLRRAHRPSHGQPALRHPDHGGVRRQQCNNQHEGHRRRAARLLRPHLDDRRE